MQIKIQTDEHQNSKIQKRIENLIEDIGQIKGVKKVTTREETETFINPLFGKSDKQYLKELSESFSKHYKNKTRKQF